MSVSLLKSVRFERLDAGLLLTEGVPDEKDTTAVRFIGRLYVQHTSKNNAVLENEAFVFSSGGSRLLCDNGIHEWCQDAGFWRDRRL